MRVYLREFIYLSKWVSSSDLWCSCELLILLQLFAGLSFCLLRICLLSAASFFCENKDQSEFRAEWAAEQRILVFLQLHKEDKRGRPACLTPHTVNRLITVNCADEERPDADWPVALMHCLLSGVAEKTYIIKHGRDDLPILRVLPRLHGHIFLSGVLLIFSPKHLHPNIRNKEKAAVWCRDRWDVWGWQENTHLFQISRTAPLAAENSRMNIFRSLLMISRVITFFWNITLVICLISGLSISESYLITLMFRSSGVLSSSAHLIKSKLVWAEEPHKHGEQQIRGWGF